MSNEIIFYTQIITIVGFILALFGVYKSLVSQKDAVIELLREQLNQQDKKIINLKAQTPDTLSKTLSERIDISEKEIKRLQLDGGKHKDEINKKEKELQKSKKQLTALAELISDTDLVCPYCSSPLTQRDHHTIFGEYNGREVEADIETSEYDCGLLLDDGGEVRPCLNRKVLTKK